MVYGIVTIGPAGVGKTTMCHALQIHGRMHKRGIFVVNLDPAADILPYVPDIDVRELIKVEDAMREFGYGPNGGLIYCMEYLAMHMEWLEEKIAGFGEDDTLLFDCPGQIELYTHLQAMPQLVRSLQESCHVRLCATFLIDAVSIDQPAKFVAAALAGLSAMLQLPVPHVTVLSKSDALGDEEKLEAFLNEGSAVLFVQNQNEIRDGGPHGQRVARPAPRGHLRRFGRPRHAQLRAVHGEGRGLRRARPGLLRPPHHVLGERRGQHPQGRRRGPGHRRRGVLTGHGVNLLTFLGSQAWVLLV